MNNALQKKTMAMKVQVTNATDYDAKVIVVRSFLIEIAKKHNVDIDDLMVGMIGDSMHIWKYGENAYDKFQQLEIIVFKKKNN